MTHMKEHGLELIKQGYKIIPIVHKKKFPPIKGWQNVESTASDVYQWLKHGYAGVGVLCKNTPAVDLDIRDKKLTLWMIDQVAEIAGKGPVRVGRSPKALLPFKTLKPFRKLASKKFVDPDDQWEEGVHPKTGLPMYKTHQVETLGDGEQFVAYGIHPDTDKPYKWSESLVDINRDDLPTLGRVQAKEIINVFEQRCTEMGFKLVQKAGTRDQCLTNPDPFQNGAFSKGIQTWTEAETTPGVKIHSPARLTTPAATPPPLQPARPPTLPPTTHGDGGAGHGAAAPPLSFAEWDRKQILDPGRLQITDATVRTALSSVDASQLDYFAWCKVGMALYHQFDGSQEGFVFWDEWSAIDAGRYESDGMVDKWKTFSTSPGQVPITFRSVLKMSEAGRKENDVLGEYVDRYVYVESEGTVHDLYGPPHKPNPPIKNFRERTANDEMEILVAAPLKDDPDRHIPKMYPVCVLWLKHDERKWVSNHIYVPNDGTGPRIVESGGYNYLNTFRMPEFPRPTVLKAEMLDVFWRHMDYLFPINDEREWFISWMALNLQHPDRRCKVTPLHISLHHGTGRGWLVTLMGQLLGHWNCTKTKMSDVIEGSWGNYLDKSLLCCIEEVHEGNKPYAVGETLRDILTEDTLQLNVKYGGIETKRVYTNFFFMSNRADALVLTETDRRINVFRNDSPPKDKEYYTALYKWSKGKSDASGAEIPSVGVCALWHWLMDRDLGGFNWQTPIKSDSRRNLIANSDNKVETLFKEVIKEMPGRVITLKILKQIMMIKAELEGDDPWQYETSKIDRQLTKMLQQKGAVARGVVKVTRQLHRPWTFGYPGTNPGNVPQQEIKDLQNWVLTLKE